MRELNFYRNGDVFLFRGSFERYRGRTEGIIFIATYHISSKENQAPQLQRNIKWKSLTWLANWLRNTKISEELVATDSIRE